MSLFVSAGASALNHHNNRFEDGYEAQLPTVTVGADYWITPRLLAGVAFNYTNFDGTYDDGGGFDKDIFSPRCTRPSCRSKEPSSTPFSAMPGARTPTPQGVLPPDLETTTGTVHRPHVS